MITEGLAKLKLDFQGAYLFYDIEIKRLFYYYYMKKSVPIIN